MISDIIFISCIILDAFNGIDLKKYYVISAIFKWIVKEMQFEEIYIRIRVTIFLK